MKIFLKYKTFRGVFFVIRKNVVRKFVDHKVVYRVIILTFFRYFLPFTLKWSKPSP